MNTASISQDMVAGTTKFVVCFKHQQRKASLKLKHIIMTGLSTLLFIVTMNSGYADSSLARELVKQGEILPLEDIIVQARALHGGRILEVELEQKHHHLVYEIELITDEGIVWELYFNARTGQLIKSKQDD